VKEEEEEEVEEEEKKKETKGNQYLACLAAGKEWGVCRWSAHHGGVVVAVVVVIVVSERGRHREAFARLLNA